jgi:Tol biopolymer transport system component
MTLTVRRRPIRTRRWPATGLVVAVAAATALLTTVSTATATTPGSNGEIVYATQLDTGYQMLTIRPDGTGVTQITNRAQADSINPDWMSNGRRIVYELDTPTTASLAITDPTGTRTRYLHPEGLTGFFAQPVFTPDGRSIVFERANPTITDDSIWLMRRDGSHVRRLTRNPFVATGGFDTDPNVSPGGTIVSFVRVRVGDSQQALFSIHLDGSHLRQLTPYGYDIAVKHDWAPDGKHIVVTINANVGTKPHRSANIAVLRPDGSHFRLLTHFRGRRINAFVGSYSPDGRWIVYRTETRDSTGTLDGGLFGLYKIHPSGGKPVLIAGLIGRPRFIDWGSTPG